MCIIEETKKGPICKHTRLPITIENAFGSFCDKECNLEAIMFAKVRAEYMLDDMGPIFKSNFES